MSETERVVEILGGKKLLGAAPKTPLELVSVMRRGVPYRSFQAAADELDVTVTELDKYLGLKQRTLHRRKGDRLSSEESERFLRLVRLAARAEEVFGSERSSREWVRLPNRELGGVSPIEMLDTDVGFDAAMRVLGRFEYGVYG